MRGLLDRSRELDIIVYLSSSVLDMYKPTFAWFVKISMSSFKEASGVDRQTVVTCENLLQRTRD
jgi:hypothetical protein